MLQLARARVVRSVHAGISSIQSEVHMKWLLTLVATCSQKDRRRCLGRYSAVSRVWRLLASGGVRLCHSHTRDFPDPLPRRPFMQQCLSICQLAH